MSNMRKWLVLSVLYILSACNTVPLTGRKQINLIPGSQINSMSFDNYRQVLKESRLSTNREWTNWVKSAGNKIKTSVETYLRKEKQANILKDFDWEFNLLKDDDMVNAWCMPGGKVAFYTGIMPVCQNEAGVAVVMGHEVAHAIARHGNERMSQALVQQLGGVALAIAIRDKPVETQALFMASYGAVSALGAILPFSRLHESEADRLGLIFMAMAGYDPREAPEFWQRMSAQGGNQPPEFLSTHPNHSTRIRNLNKWMPQALRYYNQN